MSRTDCTTEEFFKVKYGFDPFYLYSRDVAFKQILQSENRTLEDRFKQLEELEFFFARNEHYVKAMDINEFKSQWRRQLNKELKKPGV